MGEADTKHAVALITPVAVIVEVERPGFRWKGSRAAEYAVSVYDQHYSEVAQSGPLHQFFWAPSKPLKRGQRYSWQLKVLENGSEFTVPVPPAPEARFGVLSTEDEARLRALRANLARQSAPSHLALGIVYANLGLLDKARAELLQLQAENPNSQQVAGLLNALDAPTRLHRSQ